MCVTGCDLQFPVAWWCQTSFHGLLAICVFLKKCLFLILWPLFHWVVCLVVVGCRSSECLLGARHLMSQPPPALPTQLQELCLWQRGRPGAPAVRFVAPASQMEVPGPLASAEGGMHLGLQTALSSTQLAGSASEMAPWAEAGLVHASYLLLCEFRLAHMLTCPMSAVWAGPISGTSAWCPCLLTWLCCAWGGSTCPLGHHLGWGHGQYGWVTGRVPELLE